MSRPPTLRSIVIAATVSAALGLSPILASAVARPIDASVAARTSRVQIGGDSWRLFKATNESRGRFDVPKLRLNRELSVIARRHSVAMARSGDLFHTGEVEVYLHGIAWHTWGENVGYTPRDVVSLQQAFMDSPSHRANILNRAFRQVAIGSVRVGGTLWVTVFFFG